jgi:hypothetical protein
VQTTHTLLVCTTVTRATVPWARRLNAALAAHAGRTRLIVLILDDLELALDPSAEQFEVVRPDQLEIPQFELMAARFEREQLIRATEPSLIRLALERSGGDPVVYLDAQTEAFADLGDFAALAGERGVALVPRVSGPIPRDGLRPTDEDVLARGIFDPGCLACAGRHGFDRVLRSWTERMRHDGPPGAETSVPRWHDLLATFTPHAGIAEDPGLGISVWNLHERRLTAVGSDVAVDGRPLRTVCFAGLEAEPEGHAPHDDGLAEMHTRGVVFSRQPAVAGLLAERSRWLATEGRRPGDPDIARYGFAQLADGTPLTPRLRRLIWLAQRRAGFRRSPFSGPGTEELVAFLLGPSREFPGIPRFWTWLHAERSDLKEAFPDIRGADARNFMHWIIETGERENDIPPLLRVTDDILQTA